MSKASKASAAAALVAAAAPPPQFRPPPIPLVTLVQQANTDSLLPSLVHSTVNSIVHAAIERLYHAGIERAAEQFVAQQAIEDVLSVVEWQLIERDEGEEKWISGWTGMTAADDAERQSHLWAAEDEPLPTTIDRWAKHVLPVTATHDDSSVSAEAAVQAAAVVSVSDYGALSGTVSAPLDGTALFSVISASTSTSTAASPAIHSRSTLVRPTKPHRLPSPSTAAHRPRPSSTSSAVSVQPAVSLNSSQPYPLPSSSPPAASEQQRLARMATLRQQQADIADKKRREKERMAEEERKREEERAKERALMSARRQKAAAVQSARLTASESATQPRKRHTQPNTAQHEEKQQLPDTSPTSSSSSTSPILPAISAAHRTTRPSKPKRSSKQTADDSTVDGYTNAAALMASIVRAFVPAAGVRLVYGSEVKAGAEVGGSGGGEGRGRGVSVEDEQWVSVVRGMNRSQYMRWMDEQRAQAAKEADIQLRQHNTFSPPTNTQPTQPSGQQPLKPVTESDEADQHSTIVQPPIRVHLSERDEQEEKVQLTARAAVVLQPRVVTRERRELSFDSRIIADNTWGSNNAATAARNNNTRAPAYDMIGKPKSDTALIVKERKVVVSGPRRQKATRAVVGAGSERQQSASGVKVRVSSAGQVKVAADKSRLAALLQLGVGRERDSGAADGEQ